MNIYKYILKSGDTETLYSSIDTEIGKHIIEFNKLFIVKEKQINDLITYVLIEK